MGDTSMKILSTFYVLLLIISTTAFAITFTDVTKKAGVEVPMGDRWASLFADFNNDGILDIFVSGWPTTLLFMNNGDGTFTEMAQKAGVLFTGGLGADPGDYDNDS